MGLKLKSGGPGTPKSDSMWADELLLVLVKFPAAMHRCGIGKGTQQMFLDAVHSLRYVHVNPVFPRDDTQELKSTDGIIAKALRAWSEKDYPKFGRQLGRLLRRQLVLTFPKKYSVDSAGRLRRKFLRDPGHTLGVVPNILAGRQSFPMFVAVIGGCAVSIVVGLLAVRYIWLITRKCGERDIQSANRTPAVWSHETTSRSSRELGVLCPSAPPPTARVCVRPLCDLGWKRLADLERESD